MTLFGKDHRVEPDPPGDLLPLEAGEVDDEVPHLVPKGPDLLLDWPDVGATGQVRDTLATRLCPRNPVATLPLDAGDLSPVCCCCYFGVDPFAA